MRYCKKCDRELADTLEMCPFCGENTEVMEAPAEVPVQSTVSPEELVAREEARKQRLIFLGSGISVMFLILFISALGILNSELLPAGEWFGLRTTGRDSIQKAVETGMINSKDELDKFEEVYGDIVEGTPDFELLTLLWRANRIDKKKQKVYWIEKGMSSPFGCTIFLAPAKPFKETIRKYTFQERKKGWAYQSIQVLALDKLSSYPSEERISSEFSRYDKYNE